MLNVKVNNYRAREDYIADHSDTGVLPLPGRHLVAIMSAFAFSLVCSLPVGNFVELNFDTTELTSLLNQHPVKTATEESYLLSDEAVAERNMVVSSEGDLQENYDDSLPVNLFAGGSGTPSRSGQELPGKVEEEEPPLVTDTEPPIDFKEVRERFLSRREPYRELLAQNAATMDKLLSLNEQKLRQATPAPVERRPSGLWYSYRVQSGSESLGSIFEYLGLPPGTLNRIKNASQGYVVNLHRNDSLHFLTDKRNRVLELVLPLNAKEQLRLSRLDSSQSFHAVREERGVHVSNVQLASFKEASAMPLAQQAAAVRERLEQEKAAREIREARERQRQELAASGSGGTQSGSPLNQGVASADKAPAKAAGVRPRLIIGMVRQNEGFDQAARRSGLSPTEIALIKRETSGKVNFRRIVSGDSFRVLFNGVGQGSALTAMELTTVSSGRVRLFRNADNGIFYEEDGFQPSSGVFRRFPINGQIKVNSPFNPARMHPIRHRIIPHNGVDFKVVVGTPVYAPADGTVKFAGYMRGAGYCVILDHINGYSTVYMHLSKFDVKAGQSVRLGQIIARSGNTGASTGAHLHYEVRINGKPYDPLKVDLPNANNPNVARSQREKFNNTVKVLKSELYKESLAQNR